MIKIAPERTFITSDLGQAMMPSPIDGMRRFITGMGRDRFTPAEGEATLSGLYVETDDRTGLAKRCAPIRVGGRLAEARP